MTEENKNEVSTEMEVNSEVTKVELSEEEMDEINGGGGVNLAMLLDVSGKGKKPKNPKKPSKNNNSSNKPVNVTVVNQTMSEQDRNSFLTRAMSTGFGR